jgi:hypothetical protein
MKCAIVLGLLAILWLSVARPALAVSPVTAVDTATHMQAIIPEPASLSLLAVGGIALLVRRHRR